MRTARLMMTGLLGGNLRYQLRDLFSTAKAAGAVNGTTAEPGPGTRTVADTGNNITIDADGLLFSGGTADHVSTVYKLGAAIARAPGLAMLWRLVPADAGGDLVIGFAKDNYANGSFLRVNSGAFSLVSTPALPALGSYTNEAIYDFAMAARAVGCFLWTRRPGDYYRLDYVDDNHNETPLFPSATSRAAGAVTKRIRYMTVPSIAYLPTPLLSDGFGAWGTSDGLGHAEGIAGGVGSGGGSVAWANVEGTWGVTTGKAQASALANGRAVALAEVGNNNLHVSCTLTRAAGEVGIIVRGIDKDNYLKIYHDGTNLYVRNWVRGVDGTRFGATVAIGAGKLRVDVSGNRIRVWLNGARLNMGGTNLEEFYPGELQTPTKIGLFTTDLGNTVDDLVVYPSGFGGEYSAVFNRYTGFSESWLASQKYIIFDGNSLTAGNAATDFPYVTLTSLGSPYAGINVGVGGQNGYDMLQDQASQVLTRYNPSRAKNILVYWEGINSFNTYTGAEAFAIAETYRIAAQAAGFEFVMLTCHKPGGGKSADWYQRRTDYNALVIANAANYDALVRIDQDPEIGDAGDYTDLTYYQADQVHLTPAGYAIVAGLVTTAVQGLG